MKNQTLLLFAIATLGAASTSTAASVFFDLQGNAGSGLLGGNENPAVTGGGVGGELGSGIVFDDVANTLAINVGWGISNGFSANLTGNATGMHIHEAGFSVNGPVRVGLDALAGFNNAANGGGFVGTVSLTAPQVTALNAGLLYINVHTSANLGGEIRGNIVPIPEPSTSLFGVLGLSLVAFLRKRRSA